MKNRTSFKVTTLSWCERRRDWKLKRSSEFRWEQSCHQGPVMNKHIFNLPVVWKVGPSASSCLGPSWIQTLVGSKEINTLSALHFKKVITLYENKTPQLFHFPCGSIHSITFFSLLLHLCFYLCLRWTSWWGRNWRTLSWWWTETRERKRKKSRKVVKRWMAGMHASSFEIRPCAYFKFSARVTVYRCSDVAQIIDGDWPVKPCNVSFSLDGSRS